MWLWRAAALVGTRKETALSTAHIPRVCSLWTTCRTYEKGSSLPGISGLQQRDAAWGKPYQAPKEKCGAASWETVDYIKEPERRVFL